MLAAHRRGGRTSFVTLRARLGPLHRGRRGAPRRATERELRTLGRLLEASDRSTTAMPRPSAIADARAPAARPGRARAGPAAPRVAGGWRTRPSASSTASRRLQADLAGPDELDLGDRCRRASAQQEPHRLGDVLGPDHLLARDLTLDPVGHRRVDERRAQRGRLDALGRSSLCIAWVKPTTRALGGRVDRQPRLAALARDRRRVDHQRLAVLGARRAQQVDRLALASGRRRAGSRRAACRASWSSCPRRPRRCPTPALLIEHVQAAVALAVRRPRPP